MKFDSFSRVLTLEALLHRVSEWRRENASIAFTNGVFDIIHQGHLASLEQAASFADKLIVGVNSDQSARSLNKGTGRPFCAQTNRALLIAGFAAVDAVVIFEESTPYELLKQIKPDVLVKGADYKLEEIVGREFAKRVERIQLSPGLSTTKLVQKIRDSLG